jgi:hypothetical protein
VLFGLAIVAAIALLAGRTLLEPGFYDSHDGLLNVHRLFELEKCIRDGNFPCRWAPDMGYGRGSPVFNFYPPFASYVALGLRLLGASSLSAVKLSMLLSLVVGAVAMFGLARNFFGDAGGVVAATLYTWAPYRAVDVFVRGALAESWGLALLPLVFLCAERALRADRRRHGWALATALSWCALLLSHDLVCLMAAPAYAAWCLLWIAPKLRAEGAGALGSLLPFALAHLLAIALAAHFVIPALVEQQYVHLDTLTSLYPWARYENNFIRISELLFGATPWGFGAFGTPGGMSLFVGGLHWSLALAAGLGIVAFAIRARRVDGPSRAALLLGLAGGAAAGMTLAASQPLWSRLPLLALLQFPWRFLGLASFGFSFAAGWLAARAQPRRWLETGLAALLVGLAVMSGWSWFAPSAMHRVPDEVLANEREVAKARHGLFDFLPRSVDLERFPKRPGAYPPTTAEALDEQTVIRELHRTSQRIELTADVPGTLPATIRLNVHDFPGWTLRIDGESVSAAEVADPLGRIHVQVPMGTHRVSASFENTPVRSFAEWLSIFGALSAGAWLLLVWRGEARREC